MTFFFPINKNRNVDGTVSANIDNNLIRIMIYEQLMFY